MIKTICRGVIAGALLVFVASGALASPPKGVCITADLGLEGLKPGTCLSPKQLDTLLDRPVKQGENAATPLELTHPEDFSKREKIRTCRQFMEKKAEDYYALSGADMAAEGWYERTCGTVSMLKAAKRAERSFLERPDSGLSDVSVLSVRMLPVAAEVKRKEILLLAKEGLTIADLVAEGLVEVHSSSRTELDLSYGGSRARYHELARGDMNHDGLDDLVVFMGVRATGGTMGWYETLALTRRRPRGLIVMVPTAPENNNQ